jgi:hypothetical protein
MQKAKIFKQRVWAQSLTAVHVWGAQAASLQRSAACRTPLGGIHIARSKSVGGKLPPTTGWSRRRGMLHKQIADLLQPFSFNLAAN